MNSEGKKQKLNKRFQMLINRSFQDMVNIVQRYFGEVQELQQELREIEEEDKKQEKKENENLSTKPK